MINTSNSYGEIELSKGVFKDIVSYILSKDDNFKSDKKDNSFIKVSYDDSKLDIKVSIKIKQNIDVVKACSKLQNEIKESIISTCGVDINNINIDVQGFIN